MTGYVAYRRNSKATTDIIGQFKALRLHVIAATWCDLAGQNKTKIAGSRWWIEQMLKAEMTDRATRSVNHQMNAARFPAHQDLAGFDFDISSVDSKLIMLLARTEFTTDAKNMMLVGGTGTGKLHLATANGVSGITQNAKRERFYGAIDLVNALEQEKAQGKAGRIAASPLGLQS